jgi:hypothetical protein
MGITRDYQSTNAPPGRRAVLSKTVASNNGNQIRADLGLAELAQHLKRRKEIWEERRQRLSGEICPKPRGGRPPGFATDTEDKTGTPMRVTNQAITRANIILADVLGKINGTNWIWELISAS